MGESGSIRLRRPDASIPADGSRHSSFVSECFGELTCIRPQTVKRRDAAQRRTKMRRAKRAAAATGNGRRTG